MANRGWDGLGLEEGSEMVCLGPVYLETVAGVGRYQGLKLAGHGAFEEEEEENLGFKTELLLNVTSSLQLRFEPTMCLRTHLDVLYASV
ncbi:unnamed protein product [Prunus armeniaca]